MFKRDARNKLYDVLDTINTITPQLIVVPEFSTLNNLYNISTFDSAVDLYTMRITIPTLMGIVNKEGLHMNPMAAAAIHAIDILAESLRVIGVETT